MINYYGNLIDECKPWETWTPTITWSTAIPTGIVTIAKYKIIGKTCFYMVHVSATDGNNSTNVFISLPVDPKANGVHPVSSGYTKIGSSNAVKSAYVNDDGVNNNLRFDSLGTATSGSALKVYFTGFYEIA